MNKASKTGNPKKNTNNSDESSINSTNSSTAIIYRYKDVNFENATVSELNKEGSQPLAYINYENQTLNAKTKILVQSGKIKITSHGIPSLDKEGSKNNYYPDDSKREFIKVPLDPEQPACRELKAHLEAADKWAGSEEMKKKLFGKRSSKYQYQSCIKTPQKSDDADNDDDDDDDDDNKKKKGKKVKNDKENKKEYPIIDYVKMKFNVIAQEKGRINKTKLKKIEGMNKTVVHADTITQVANEINFLSEIKFIFYYNKIWANKTPAQGATMITYGIGFKIMAIEYTPNASKGLNSADIDFLPEEEDDEEVNANEGKTKNNKSQKKLDDDDDDNTDDNEENNGKLGKESKTKEISDKKNSKNKKNSNEDEENDEENDEGKNDETPDEDDISVKKSKKNSDKKSKKSSKNSDEDEEVDEEEEEEEIKPKKKSGKNKSSSKSR